MALKSLFGRREKPPQSALDLLDKDERVVSWGDTPGGSVVVATTHGVWWPFAEEPRRIPWQQIDKAVWRDNVLELTEADIVDDELLVDKPVVRASLQTPRDLPPTIRKRIEANIVRSELLSVGGGAVRFVARRRPGHDGMVWWARLEPGTRADEQVRSAISARLSILRSADRAD